MLMQVAIERIDSQINLTTPIEHVEGFACPGENLLRLISGKWKPQLIGLASRQPVRFNTLLRQLPGSNKQSLSVALKELEEANILSKSVISEKPLHIEYSLTERGRSLLSIFRLASRISHDDQAS
jgi:DNA-binding HxlR family transcriptional regulator